MLGLINVYNRFIPRFTNSTTKHNEFLKNENQDSFPLNEIRFNN